VLQARHGAVGPPRSYKSGAPVRSLAVLLILPNPMRRREVPPAHFWVPTAIPHSPCLPYNLIFLSQFRTADQPNTSRDQAVRLLPLPEICRRVENIWLGLL